MFVVDTNLLLYALNPDAPEHERALRALEEWRSGERPWFLTWAIVYEFLRVSTHPSVFTEPLDLPTAREWIDAVVAAPACGILTETDRHGEVLLEVAQAHPRVRGNLIHDLHIVVLMKEHGISEIRTADRDFHQFPFLRVVDPLQP